MANRYFCRFTNVTIVNGADIRNCFARFTAYDGQVTDNIQLNCYFVDADNPDAPADKAELDGFSLTSGVAWNSLPAWQDGSEYMTPDLAPLLEAVVGRSGWASGNAVILVIEDNSSPSDVHRKISAYEYGSGLEKPSLNVGWYSEVEGFFDNTKWEPDQLNPATPIETLWDSPNSEWDFNIAADSDGGRLVVKGTWHVNYQPSEMTIKHTHAGTPELKIYAADGIIYHSLGYTSEDIITPLWVGRSEGIYAFQFMLAAGDNTPFSVTDITFNSAAPAAQTTTSTSSTASTTSSTSSTASTTSTSSSTSTTISSTSTSSTASTTSSTSTTASTSTSTSSTASSTSTATTGSTYSTFSTTHTTTTSTSTSTSTTASTASTTSTASTISTTSSTSTTASTISTSSSTSTISTTSSTSTTASTISTTTSTSSSTSTISTTTTTTSPPNPYGWDPAQTDPSLDLTNENRTATANQNSALTAISKFTKSSGKWYWEIGLGSGGANWWYGSVGVCDASGGSNFDETDRVGWDESWSHYDTGAGNTWSMHNGTFVNSNYGSHWADNDYLMVAVDIPNGKLWIGRNGTWFNGGDPAAGTNPAMIDATMNTLLAACITLRNDNNDCTARFEASQMTDSPPVGFITPDGVKIGTTTTSTSTSTSSSTTTTTSPP